MHRQLATGRMTQPTEPSEKRMAGVHFNCVGTVQNSGFPPLQIQIIIVPGEREKYFFSSWRAGCELKDGDGHWSPDIAQPQWFEDLESLGGLLAI